jgi:hypothetical protein
MQGAIGDQAKHYIRVISDATHLFAHAIKCGKGVKIFLDLSNALRLKALGFNHKRVIGRFIGAL